jgi:hypothetical protein
VSFMRFLGGRPADTASATEPGYASLDAETEAVRHIVSRLEALPP